MHSNETILVAPLNWGLGHATRCVPLINQLLADENKVLLAGHGSSLAFLRQEFPQLEALILKGHTIRYTKSKIVFFSIFLQMPFFLLDILVEHRALKKLLKKHPITQVISDNRYGLWNKHVKSTLITHQLFIQLPHAIRLLEPLLHFITRMLISPFDVCWIPDYESMEQSLSGKLSHGKRLPVKTNYLGPLSRFMNYKYPNTFICPQQLPDVLILISGPEPFRSSFQNQMEQRFAKTDKKILMVCGQPDQYEKTKETGTEYNSKTRFQKVSHLTTPELYYYLSKVPQLISLAGYSTIMDLHALGREAELIPTPGQTEQEYLVKWTHIKTTKAINRQPLFNEQ